jgi:hypothetical protein
VKHFSAICVLAAVAGSAAPENPWLTVFAVGGVFSALPGNADGETVSATTAKAARQGAHIYVAHPKPKRRL